MNVNAATVLVGRGLLTLKERTDLMQGALLPEELLRQGRISAHDYTALTGRAAPLFQGRPPESFQVTRGYDRGAICIFNGSSYYALESCGGQPPPVDPRWVCIAQGMSTPVPYDVTATYYQGQLVTSAGGTYLLTAPTAPAGTPPTEALHWVALVTPGAAPAAAAGGASAAGDRVVYLGGAPLGPRATSAASKSIQSSGFKTLLVSGQFDGYSPFWGSVLLRTDNVPVYDPIGVVFTDAVPEVNLGTPLVLIVQPDGGVALCNANLAYPLVFYSLTFFLNP